MGIPIRILIVDGKLICGGVESFIMNIYRHIDRTKVQFDFLVHYKDKYFYDDEIESLGGRIYYLTFRNDNNFIKYKKDLKNFFLNHNEYKVVWGHMDGLASIYMKIAKKCGVNIKIAHSHITNSEKNFKGFLKKILRRNLCKYTDLNFACSSEAGQYLFGKNRFILVHNAIDVKKYTFNINTRNIIRNEYNIGPNTYVIGNVGRFYSQKNHKFLIKVFSEFHQSYGNSKLLLCGDGELIDEMKELAINLNISKDIIFCGNVSNVNDMYQAMDVFVMPSLYEGLPVSGIEAQANGLPCIFSDTITKEVMMNEKQVKFVSISDYKLWVNELKNIKNRVKNSEKDIIENGYSIEDLSNKLTKLFIDLSEEKICINEVNLYD